MFGGPGVGFSWILGSAGGSLWSPFFDVFRFFGVKVGAEIVDVFFSAFQVEKRPQDGGFLLLKHRK